MQPTKILYSIFVLIVFINCLVYETEVKNRNIKSYNVLNRELVTADSIQINCYDSPKYFVLAKEILGNSGTDFLIKYKSRPNEKLPCNYIPGRNDFEIKNEWAEYYAGLKGDLLILDSTTGPGPSGLIIWDLKKRKKVFDGTWSDAEESKDNTLVYWLETGEANYKNCPELKKWKSQGLEGAIETKVILDLSNFKISKTKETRCSPRQ